FFFLGVRLPTRSTLFPYTTLFRSAGAAPRPACARRRARAPRARGAPRPALRRVRGASASQATRPPDAPVTYGASAADALEEAVRSEEHTSELQSLAYLVCRLLLEK